MARQLGGRPPHQPEDQRRPARGDGRRRRHARRGAPLAGRAAGGRLVRARRRRCSSCAPPRRPGDFRSPCPAPPAAPGGRAAGFGRDRRGGRRPAARQLLRGRDRAPRHRARYRDRAWDRYEVPLPGPFPLGYHTLRVVARRGDESLLQRDGGAHRLPRPGLRGARGRRAGARAAGLGRRPLRRAFRAQRGRRRPRRPAAPHPLGHARARRPLHRAQPAARDRATATRTPTARTCP